MTDTTTTDTDTTANEGPKKRKPRTPRNLQRAVKLRGYTFGRDYALLDKWVAYDTTGQAQAIKDKLDAIRIELRAVADLYESLPKSAMSARRGRSASFEEGVVVKVKEKFIETYAGMLPDNGTEYLVVRGQRDTHVLVEATNGERFFLHRKELEVREDA